MSINDTRNRCCPINVGKTRWINRSNRNRRMIVGLINEVPAYLAYCNIGNGDYTGAHAVAMWWLGRADYIRVRKLP